MDAVIKLSVPETVLDNFWFHSITLLETLNMFFPVFFLFLFFSTKQIKKQSIKIPFT